MIDHEAAWRERSLARWMREDAARWIRADAARFLKPGTDPADVYPALARKYNPNQPRVPAGETGGGRWTDGEGGDSFFTDMHDKPQSDATDLSGQRRGGPPRSSFPNATLEQNLTLDLALARSGRAIGEIHRYDPTWQPRATSVRAIPGSVDGAINEANARATEAEAHLARLRTRIGGNLGPPLEPIAPSISMPPRNFDPVGWINTYRTINNSVDMFGFSSWPFSSGTVAAGQIDGTIYFGTNSDAPGYVDRLAANEMRDLLYEKYSELRRGENRGFYPFNAPYHAEATILFRARASGVDLSKVSAQIYVDRRICDSCNEVLPRVALELGNPYVTYIETTTGRKSVMWNGTWLIWRQP